MSANPIVDVIRMMMEMYPDMTDPRGNVESGVGAPGTAGVGKAVTPFADTDPGIADPRNPTREEIDAITKSVMYEKMMKREMREGRFSEPPLPIRGLNPEIQRHMDDRPINGRNPLDEPRFHRYLEPDTPDPIGKMIPQVLQQLASVSQTTGVSPVEMINTLKSPSIGHSPMLLRGRTDEEIEDSWRNVEAEAQQTAPPPQSYPPVPGLTPDLMRAISDQYERFPDANPLNNKELNEYLEPDTPDPIARMLPAIAQQLASLTQTYGGGTGQHEPVFPDDEKPTQEEEDA